MAREGAVARALPEIAALKCTACGACISACHADALALNAGVLIICSPDCCDYCTDCELVCPEGAIRCPFELIFED